MSRLGEALQKIPRWHWAVTGGLVVWAVALQVMQFRHPSAVRGLSMLCIGCDRTSLTLGPCMGFTTKVKDGLPCVSTVLLG